MAASPLGSLLIVDDEVAQMTALCRTLEPEGYRTTGVTNGRDAVAALHRERFDLLLTDLMMPDIDGIELLRMAFAIDPQLVGIVMTGHATVNTAVEAMKAGALDYILKPFNLRVIKPVLTRALTLRQLRLENIQLRETVGMYELSMTIAFAPDAAAVLGEVVDAAWRQSDDGDAAILRTTDDAQVLAVAAARGRRAESHVGLQMRIDSPLTAWIARSRDLLARVDELPDVEAAFAPPVPAIADGIALPMLSGGRLTGVFCFALGDARRPIARERVKSLNILASTAAAALERQSLEEQLRHSQKMEAVGRLTAGVAHDFNNLLTVINGYSDLMLADPTSGHLRRQIEEVKRAGELAAALTRQLLAFGRRQVTQPAVLNLNAVVEHHASILRRVIGEVIELVTRLDPALALVKADRVQIEQVLINLAVNARDAMPGGGTLTIETRNVTALAAAGAGRSARGWSHVHLVVTDTGCGMDAATRTRIFEPFFTTKTLGRGTGLGLSVVHGIVMQTDGTITVDTAPGRGTSFTIQLPVVAHAESPPTEPLAADRPIGGTETILVVEDETTVRQFICTVLEHAGYDVLRARNGNEAMDLYRQAAGPVRLVVTDLVMPHMSGPALVDILTRLDPAPRVLYISGYADDALASQGQPDPSIPLLPKPFTSNTLLQRVREALDRRNADTRGRSAAT